MNATSYDAAAIEVLSGLGSGPQTAGHVHRYHSAQPSGTEVIDNSVDEAIAGHANTVMVTLTCRRFVVG